MTAIENIPAILWESKPRAAAIWFVAVFFMFNHLDFTIMNTNVSIQSKKVQKFIKEHSSTFSEEIFIDLLQRYIEARLSGTLLFVKKKERKASSLYRIGYTKHSFYDFIAIFKALGFKVDSDNLCVVLPFSSNDMIKEVNGEVVEFLLNEGMITKEESRKLIELPFAAV